MALLKNDGTFTQLIIPRSDDGNLINSGNQGMRWRGYGKRVKLASLVPTHRTL